MRPPAGPGACLVREAAAPGTSHEDEPDAVADRVRALRKAYRDEAAALEKELRAAKTGGDKKAVRGRLSALRPKFADKAVALAAAEPADAGAFKAATFALLELGAEGAPAKRAAEIISGHHADNPKLKSLLPDLGETADGVRFLRAVHEKATDKDVKGAALYFAAAKMIEDADDPRGAGLPETERAAAFKEAGALLTRAAKEYGDVEVAVDDRKRSIAKAVEGQLYVLNNLTVGRVLPDSACEDLGGKTVKISDYRGKVVVLDIWTTGCGPCRAMIPHARELVKSLKGKPFAFISLSADDDKDVLVKFLEREPMPWVHWWNGGPKGGPEADYRVQFHPTIYVLDAKGVIRYKHVRENAMDEAVGTLLKELAPKN